MPKSNILFGMDMDALVGFRIGDACSESNAVITTLIMVVGILCTRLHIVIIPSVDNRTILETSFDGPLSASTTRIISTALVVHSQLRSVSASVPRPSGCYFWHFGPCCDLR